MTGSTLMLELLVLVLVLVLVLALVLLRHTRVTLCLGSADVEAMISLILATRADCTAAIWHAGEK